MNLMNYLKNQDKKFAIILIISFLVIFSIVIFSNHYSIFSPGLGLSGFEEGKPASRDLVADHNYDYIDTDASEKKIVKELRSIVPVFEKDNETTESILNDFSFFSEQYLLDKESKTGKRLEGSSMLAKLFNLEEIQFLLEKIDPYRVIPDSSELIGKILDKGVFEITDKVSYNELTNIQIWQWEKGRKVANIIPATNITTINDVDKIVKKDLLLKKLSETEKYAVQLIVEKFIKVNVFYDNVQTQLRYDTKRKEVDPVLEEVHTGDLILRKGFIISAEDMKKAIALNGREKNINILGFFSVFIFLLLLYIFAILMFKPLFSNNRRKYQYANLLISFYLAFIIYTSLILQFDFIGSFYLSLFLPTALFSMMIVILIGFQESIFAVLILSLSLFLFPDTNAPSFLFSLISGISAAFLLRGVKKRIDLVKPVVFLALINISSLIIGFPKYIDSSWLVPVVLLATLNAFLSSIINLTLIPVFEHYLNIPTVFKLLELSDMNSPVFRKMVTVAPGTYGHSIAVANLADAACRDVGANSLLARVGAYYHDIGKLDQSEYFIENQTESNKHDMLNPSLSVAVIKSHVKMGVEKAKEMGLPFEIIDIISQHHGSGLIGYFYIEAINKEGSNNKIQQKDYSYTGIPPESKEAAIVMLADTVEAASRVLKKPTILKLEKFIWKLIMEKIERGQMVNTTLTMNDMHIIKKSFVHILSGYFHNRIEYPKINTNNKRKRK